MEQVKTLIKKGRKSYWIKSGSLTLLNRILVSFFGFLNFYLLIRILPQTDYGVWMLFISVATVMELIKAGFIRNPLIKFSHQKKSYVQVLTASFILNLILAAMMGGLLLIFAGSLSIFWNHASLQRLFHVYVIVLFLLVPLNHFDYVQQANLSFKGSLFSEFTRQFVFFVFLITFHLTHRPVGLVTLAYFQVISVGLSVVVSFIFAHRYLTFAFKTNFHWLKKLFGYGKYTFGTSVSAMLMRNTDTWMLGSMMSPLAVAIYNPALRIANLLEIPALTLASILFPKLTKRIGEKGEKSAKNLYEKSVGAILACVLPFVLFVLVFAEPVTVFIAGEEYKDTVPILRVTVIYCLLLPFNRQLGITLEAIGKARKNFYFVIRNALLNVCLNYIFIIHFGVMGAAYGTLLTYLLSFVYNQIYLHKFLKVSLSDILHYTLSVYGRVYQVSLSHLSKKVIE